MLESTGVSILNNVLRLLSVLNYGSRDAIQALIISADDHLIKLVLTCQYAPHQIGVVYCIRLIVQRASNYFYPFEAPVQQDMPASERQKKLGLAQFERTDRKLMAHGFHGHFGNRTPVLVTMLLEN